MYIKRNNFSSKRDVPNLIIGEKDYLLAKIKKS